METVFWKAPRVRERSDHYLFKPGRRLRRGFTGGEVVWWCLTLGGIIVKQKFWMSKHRFRTQR